MLAIGEVDDDEPLVVIEADTSKLSSAAPKLLPGKTSVVWEAPIDPVRHGRKRIPYDRKVLVILLSYFSRCDSS